MSDFKDGFTVTTVMNPARETAAELERLRHRVFEAEDHLVTLEGLLHGLLLIDEDYLSKNDTGPEFRVNTVLLSEAVKSADKLRATLYPE